ncbi:MAG: simple sugar transport system ATP-binding protein [Fusobacteria bacterium]|nr:MAG: simple sugar transport system ATP-binding protein [Fusobacteriota bacterium]KAF0229332.1 MAG: simple sugar transport system ATP-binding [Fusobacteriota bacterium]
MSNAVVEMKNIRKVFPGGVVANDKVDLTIEKGEIHALLGENGAGKSTLMNILTGLYRQDDGELFVDGQKIEGKYGPKEAIAKGIGMVHQNFRLVKPFTVSENMALGTKDKFLYDGKIIESKIEEISKKFQLQISPKAKIWQLSIGEQQRVEIIKMLYRGAQILIMDEPTAVLTPNEVKGLFDILKAMTKEGISIIFITHKMHEVLSYADRITVLRGGFAIKTLNAKDTNDRELADLMVGRQLDAKRMIADDVPLGEVVLKLSDVRAMNDKGLLALDNVSFEIRGGEILGIAGVAGNGQKELSEVITGLRKVTAGKIMFKNDDITKESVQKIIDRNVAFIPEDRHGMGLANNLPATDNAILKSYRNKRCGGILMNKKVVDEITQKMVDDFEIKIPNIHCNVKLMSGGNLQKLILARETFDNPELIIAVYPVRGLDVGAIDYVHQKLAEERKKGKAVLLISEDLEEIYKMTDRVAVLYEGKVMGIVKTQEASINDLGLMMAGAKGSEA